MFMQCPLIRSLRLLQKQYKPTHVQYHFNRYMSQKQMANQLLYDHRAIRWCVVWTSHHMTFVKCKLCFNALCTLKGTRLHTRKALLKLQSVFDNIQCLPQQCGNYPANALLGGSLGLTFESLGAIVKGYLATGKYSICVTQYQDADCRGRFIVFPIITHTRHTVMYIYDIGSKHTYIDYNISHTLFEPDSVMKANIQTDATSIWVPELCHSFLLCV